MRLVIFLSAIILSVFIVIGSFSINTANEISIKPFEGKQITVKPSNSLKQGQTAVIEVRTDQNLLNPYLLHNGNKVKLYRSTKDTYRGLVGFEATEKAGKYKISLADETGYLNDETYVNLAASKFPIQNIRVSGKGGGLGATKDELNKVQNFKDRITDNPYWSQPPFNSPSNGCIISIYGLNRYYNGKPSGNYHKGIDIKAPQGRDIRSITGGKVVIAEQFRLHGGTVAVDHGQGLSSIYLHMSKIHVKPGDTVSKDQVIGKVGSTGFATGPHLHWGLYINGVPVDPMNYWIKPVQKCS